MRIDSRVKISKDSQSTFVVTSKLDPRYSRVWKKAALSQLSRDVYGTSLYDWIHIHKYHFREWRLKLIRDSDKLPSI